MKYYRNVKIYFDGSHYIGIPHTEKPKCKKQPTAQPLLNGNIPVMESEESANKSPVLTTQSATNTPQYTIDMKALFDELYGKYIFMRKKERKAKISEEMSQYFSSTEQLAYFDVCQAFFRDFFIFFENFLFVPSFL